MQKATTAAAIFANDKHVFRFDFLSLFFASHSKEEKHEENCSAIRNENVAIEEYRK